MLSFLFPVVVAGKNGKDILAYIKLDEVIQSLSELSVSISEKKGFKSGLEYLDKKVRLFINEYCSPGRNVYSFVYPCGPGIPLVEYEDFSSTLGYYMYVLTDLIGLNGINIENYKTLIFSGNVVSNYNSFARNDYFEIDGIGSINQKSMLIISELIFNEKPYRHKGSDIYLNKDVIYLFCFRDKKEERFDFNKIIYGINDSLSNGNIIIEYQDQLTHFKIYDNGPLKDVTGKVQDAVDKKLNIEGDVLNGSFEFTLHIRSSLRNDFSIRFLRVDNVKQILDHLYGNSWEKKIIRKDTSAVHTGDTGTVAHSPERITGGVSSTISKTNNLSNLEIHPRILELEKRISELNNAISTLLTDIDKMKSESKLTRSVFLKVFGTLLKKENTIDLQIELLTYKIGLKKKYIHLTSEEVEIEAVKKDKEIKEKERRFKEDVIKASHIRRENINSIYLNSKKGKQIKTKWRELVKRVFPDKNRILYPSLEKDEVLLEIFRKLINMRDNSSWDIDELIRLELILDSRFHQLGLNLSADYRIDQTDKTMLQIIDDLNSKIDQLKDMLIYYTRQQENIENGRDPEYKHYVWRDFISDESHKDIYKSDIEKRISEKREYFQMLKKEYSEIFSVENNQITG